LIIGKMWFWWVVVCCVWALVKCEITNSLRELAGGAFLKATPFGNKQLIGKTVDRTFHYVSKLDSEDCSKKLLCGLAGKVDKLTWDEELMLQAFQSPIDYTSPYVQLRVAVEVGRKNVTNCKMVYSRCTLELHEMTKVLRRQGISFEIPGAEKDCSVYFLWKTTGRKKGERAGKNVPGGEDKQKISTVGGEDKQKVSTGGGDKKEVEEETSVEGEAESVAEKPE